MGKCCHINFDNDLKKIEIDMTQKFTTSNNEG